MGTYRVKTGAVDLKTNSNVTINNNNFKDEAHPVIYKMREGVTTFKHPNTGAITAIDLGTQSGLILDNFYEEYSCGAEVTVFYSTNKKIEIYSASAMGKFLSKVDLMKGSMPYIAYYEGFAAWGAYPIVIDNENFINEGGLFQYYDQSQASYLTFEGSTFKTAPRIFSKMDEFGVFPYDNSSNIWEPFKNCPNIEKIEYQGDFSEKLNYLTACNFTYTDTEGIERIDAYPQGGTPRFIYEYVNVGTYTVGRSGEFPKFDTSMLEIAIRPAMIENIDTQASSMQAPEVIGIDLNGAPKLRIVDINVPNLILPDELPFMYGTKLLGYKGDWPSLQEARGDVYSIKSSVEERVIEDERILTYPIFTPDFVSSFVNSGWGTALKKTFDDTEPLLAPAITSNQLKVVSNYYSRETQENEGPFFVPTSSGLTGFTIPPLPEGVEVINGYCKDLYAGAFICDDYPVEFNEQIVMATQEITIPKLPSTVKVVKDYLTRTFYKTFGEGEDLESTRRGERELHAVYGSAYTKRSDRDVENRLYMLLNIDESSMVVGGFWSYSSRHINVATPYTTAPVTSADEELTFSQLINKAFGNTDEQPEYTKTYRITSGITLEQNNLPNLEYAINWMNYTWLDSRVDPTKVHTMLPLPEGVKSEKAYEGILLLEAVDALAGVRRLTFQIGSIAGEDFRSITLIGKDGSTLLLDEENMNDLSYDIEDVLTPSNFFIQNENNKTYDALFNSFNFLFYGNFYQWVLAHGGGDSNFNNVLEYLTSSTDLTRPAGAWGYAGGNVKRVAIQFNGREGRQGSDWFYYTYAGYDQSRGEMGMNYMPSGNHILSNNVAFVVPYENSYSEQLVNISTDVMAGTFIMNHPPVELEPRLFE